MILKSALAILCLLPAALPVRTATAATELVRIGTAPRVASSMSGMGAIVDTVNAATPETGVEAVEVETGGSLDNLRRLERGQIDVGTVSTHSLGLTLNPSGQVVAGDRLAVLGIYSMSPEDVYVRSDSGVDVLGELNGKPFIAGGAGTGTERTTMAVFKALGIKPVWVRVAMDQIPEAIARGEAVGFVKSGTAAGPDKLVVDLAATTPLKALPLPMGQKGILAAKVEGVSEWPAGDRKGTAVTWADPVLVVGLRGLSDQAARAIAGAMLQTGSAAGLDRRLVPVPAGIPLHPAVEALLAEQEPPRPR